MASVPSVQTASPFAFVDRVPGLRQFLALVGLAAAVAIGISVVLWSHSGSERVLFSNLTERDAAEVVQALDGAGIPFSYQAGSGVILVREDAVHSARLMLAAEGLPRGAGVGFEMLQEPAGFSDSQFMENARYQRALEIELQRTIASISAIRGARVHLAIPRQTVFVRDRRPASASVLLELHQGRRLEAVQVDAIVNLVAASVLDMERSQISVIDQHGNLLSGGARAEPGSLGRGGEVQVHELEERLARRIEGLLSPITGAGRVLAQVAIDMDFSSRHETQEVFDHANQVVRSEQLSEQRRPPSDAVGVPGAMANQPFLEDDNNGDREGSGMPMSQQSVRNFEIGRTIRSIQSGAGEMRRISVAVVIDQPRVREADGERILPYSEEEMDRFTILVRDAVGFDAERGDSVSVVQSAFRSIDFDELATIDEPGVFSRIDWMAVARIVASVIIVLLLLLLVVRPLMKALVLPPQPVYGFPGQAQTLALAGPGDAQDDAMRGLDGDARDALKKQMRSYQDKVQAVKNMARSDAQGVAKVVSQWLKDGSRAG